MITRQTLDCYEYLKDELEFDNDMIKEVFENHDQGEFDFEVNDYRFIHKDHIDEIMKDELLSDEYVLGCFTAWFIADILGESTGLTYQDIEDMQKAEQYSALGRMLSKHIDEVQKKYVSCDGYGHHFAH